MKQIIYIFFLFSLLVACKESEVTKDEENPSLSIESISPEYGKAGNDIVLKGSGFGIDPKAISVSLGGISAEVKTVNGSQMVIQAPTDATHGTITVKAGEKTTTSTKTFFYEPEITSLSAFSGKGGDEITITGKHFLASTTDMEVKFNGVLANIISGSNTSLKVKVPENVSTGTVTVNHKNRAPISGPAFSVVSYTDLFTVVSGSAKASLVLNTGEVFIVDDIRNTLYALSSDLKKIIKVNLGNMSQSVLLEGASPFLLGNSASPFTPTSMALSDDGSFLYLLCTTNNSTGTQTNVFKVQTTSGAVTPMGNRKIGMVGLGGLTGGGSNLGFYVDDKENIYTRHNDGNIINFQSLTKFSPDLTSLSHIIGTRFSGSNTMLRIDKSTFRAMYYYVFEGNRYNDIVDGVAGAVKAVPGVVAAYYQISRGGMGKFYTIQRIGANGFDFYSLSTDWTERNLKAKITIDKKGKVNNMEFGYFIDRMYTDGNGNYYVGVNLNVQENSFRSELSGIYKISL